MGSLRDPIPLPPNPVTRFYRGGGRHDAFRGASGTHVPADVCEDCGQSLEMIVCQPGTDPPSG